MNLDCIVQNVYMVRTGRICMKLINIQLFGIAIILAGGFLLTAEAVVTQRPIDVYFGTWIVAIGLVISIVAILRAWFASNPDTDSVQESL